MIEKIYEKHGCALSELELSFFVEAEPLKEKWLNLAEKLDQKVEVWEDYQVRFASFPEKCEAGESYVLGDAHIHFKDSESALHWNIKYEYMISDFEISDEAKDVNEKTGDLNDFLDKLVKLWPSNEKVNCKIETKYALFTDKVMPKFWPKTGFPPKKVVNINGEKTAFKPYIQTYEIDPRIGSISKVQVRFDKKQPVAILKTQGYLDIEIKPLFFEMAIEKIFSDLYKILREVE